LPIIVEKIGANIFLMPSICPETFSYVTQELIDMEVPLVCFDIGAQAEKIKNYHKGLIISYDSTPNEILEQIEQFHKKLIEQEMNR
jgi:glycosyltransferase involved in cell wall biosynthesis